MPLGVAGVIAAAFLLLHLPFLPASLEDHRLDQLRPRRAALRCRSAPAASAGISTASLRRPKCVHVVVPSEAHALSMLSIVSGTLSVLALGALFRRIDRDPRSGQWAMLATILSATAPLYWFNASRPLSDMPGLAASIGVQAFTSWRDDAHTSGGRRVSRRTRRGYSIAGDLAHGSAPPGHGGETAASVPDRGRARCSGSADRWRCSSGLCRLSGSVADQYVLARAVRRRGRRTLPACGMLWTTHTPRQVLLAFNSTFVAPWGTPVLSGVVLVLALLGILRLMWGSRSDAGAAHRCVRAVSCVRSALSGKRHDTIRTARSRTARLSWRERCGGVSAADGCRDRRGAGDCRASGGRDERSGVCRAGGARVPAAARTCAQPARSQARAPVLATHRREELDMRRPITWMGSSMPTFSQRLPATPKHEWLELVKYWNDGGRAPVWFVADPLRSDLALVDHGAACSVSVAAHVSDSPRGRPTERNGLVRVR